MSDRLEKAVCFKEKRKFHQPVVLSLLSLGSLAFWSVVFPIQLTEGVWKSVQYNSPQQLLCAPFGQVLSSGSPPGKQEFEVEICMQEVYRELFWEQSLQGKEGNGIGPREAGPPNSASKELGRSCDNFWSYKSFSDIVLMKTGG